MKPTQAIVIMDGFGYSAETFGNAIKSAGTPNIDALQKTYPSGLIEASGLSVGLPEGQMGNSEVGHLNLGAGRVVYQDITRIDKAIADGEFSKNPVFLDAVKNVQKNRSAMHLVGLCSDGGVHSHLNHMYALVHLCKAQKLKNVYIHCITDGRDVAPDSARSFIAQVEKKCAEIGAGKVATVIGRYYYMDRDNRWDRVEKGYNGVFEGKGAHYSCADSAVAASYANGVFDEFIKPSIIGEYKGVQNGDSVIFYNFRSDRAREISRAVIEDDFAEFVRENGKKEIFYAGMTQYDEAFKSGIYTAFAPKEITNTLGEYLAKNNLTQARVAETEKYAHVTFFFNGGVEEPNSGERRVLVASPKVATYDLQPEMSAYEVAEKALEQIGEVDVLILNFANCDMVGHTGVLNAAEKAVKTVDECVGRVAEKILALGGNMILTADHGNAEVMLFPGGSPSTAHTTNPVPLIIVGKNFENSNKKIRKNGSLSDVAPTLLKIMGLKKPPEMDGESLI
ncbi:MAG: 2,3-bisphosphoglycerate-independent phosphoglycerate mutase [Firmicutes bacterium]|nr:2,3-bisphosphoglycerate-independent phosphoglycerate mutase [Bacillota bacterium]